MYQSDTKYCIVFQGFPSFESEKENLHPYFYIMLFSVVCKVLILLSNNIRDLRTEREKETVGLQYSAQSGTPGPGKTCSTTFSNTKNTIAVKNCVRML